MNQHEFIRIYNNFYVFPREGECTIVSPSAVGEEKGSRDPRVCRGRQWVAGARRRRDLGGSGEPGRDDDKILGASMLRTAGGKTEKRTARRRRSPGGWGGRRGGGGRRGSGGTPEAREDGAAAAEPRRPGRVGEEAARIPGADGGGPMVWWGARVSADFGRPAAEENPVGQRTGAPRKRRSGRMTATAADWGRKSG
jgi:hypothetical protein